MKITTAILTTLGLIAFFPACTKQEGDTNANKEAEACADDAIDEDGCGECPDAEAGVKEAPADKYDKMVKGITLTEFTKISEILAAPADFLDKRVLVKGEALALCAKRGCWVTLKSDADESKSLRVKVKDGEIVFPMTAKGNEVIAEGIVEKLVVPVESLRESLKKRAEAAGEEFDPASVTEPRIIWQIHGLGAKWDES